MMPTGLVVWLTAGVDLALLGVGPALLAIAVQRPAAALAPQALFSAATLAGMVIAARRG